MRDVQCVMHEGVSVGEQEGHERVFEKKADAMSRPLTVTKRRQGSEGNLSRRCAASVSPLTSMLSLTFTYASAKNDICSSCRDAEIPPHADSRLCPACPLKDLGLLN